MRAPLISVCVLAFSVLMIALAISSSEARSLRSIESDHTLKVGMSGDYPLFSLRSADGQISGADVTMAQELAKALGVELEIVPTTWRTMQVDLQADRFDIVMGGVTVTPERAALGEFSLPFCTMASGQSCDVLTGIGTSQSLPLIAQKCT